MRHALAAVLGGLVALAAVPALADELPLGQRVFIRECAKCHDVGPKAHNKVGPRLTGLVGRKAGSVADFKYYSAANRDADIVWTPEALSQFIRDPRAMMIGTTQVYRGLKDDREIEALIDYLKAQ